MGLILAAAASLQSTLGDQWKEFFYCEGLDKDVLVVKGTKRTSGLSSNYSSNNIITSGSGIAVADGQCAIIVDTGAIVEMCAEPGEYKYDASTEGSIFAGSLGDGIKMTWETLKKRFSFGGDTGKDQRIYYFNLKEITDNKFGTANPIPFRAVDTKIGLDLDTAIRCSGVYSYRIADPMLFYKNVCGNVERAYTREDLETQLKTEFISALQPALAKLSTLGLRPSELVAYTPQLEENLNEVLSDTWGKLRGLKVVNVALGSVTIPEEDSNTIKELQKAAVYQNPGMAAASMVSAQNDAIRTAAGNEAGATVGFMGVNMAMNAGGVNAQDLYNMAAAQPKAEPAPAAVEPALDPNTWTCECGSVNTGNFCPQCGKAKPVEVVYKCSVCGYGPTDPKNPPKFCPECGKKLGEEDLVH